MRKSLIIIILLVSSKCYSQVDCSSFKDDAKIYTKSVDTLVAIVLKSDPSLRIKIVSAKEILEELPTIFLNQKIKKAKHNNWDFTPNGTVWINIEPLYCKNDTIRVTIEIRLKQNDKVLIWETGCRKTLQFVFDKTKSIYTLIEIIPWIVIR